MDNKADEVFNSYGNVENVLNECQYKEFKRKFPLPQFESIFTPERSPFDNTPIVKEWLNWCFELSIMPMEKFKNFSGTVVFAAYFWPAANLHRFENLLKIMIMFFIYDDHNEAGWGDIARGAKAGESQRIWGQLSLALKKLTSDTHIPMNGWKPYVLGMYAIFEDVLVDFNRVQKERFVECWQGWIDGNVEETERVEKGIKLDEMSLDELLKIRRKSAGMLAVVQLIEYSDNLFVHEQDWKDSEMQILFEFVTDAVTLGNDLYSFEKELIMVEGKLENNFSVVSFLILTENLSIPEALERCKDMLHEKEVSIKETVDIMKEDNKWRKETVKFIERVVVAVAGNSKGSGLCDRYMRYV